MNKKKRDTLYSIWSILILISVLLVLFSLLFASATKDYGSGKAKDNTAAASGTDAVDNQSVKALTTSALLAVSTDAGNDYIGRMTFLCDSTTAGLKPNSLLPDGAETKKVLSTADGKLALTALASAKISTADGEASITDAVKAAKPDILVITLGVDGAAYMGETYFTTQYKSLLTDIKAACPNTVIICNSILPVSQTYGTANGMTADTVRQANNWIQQSAAYSGCKYADSYSALCDDNGYLQASFDSGDGLNPNAAGLTAMINYLRTHAVS